MIEVRLFGAMELLVDGASLPLGTPKQQVVLAMLAVRPGRLVTVEELVDELWPERPPPSAVANTRTYAANLRRTLDRTARTRQLFVRQGSGYQFGIRPEDVDLLRFEVESRDAKAAFARGDVSAAESLLAVAEERVRGPLLAGLPLGPVLSARAEAVGEQLLGLAEQRAELYLASGRHGAAVSLLREHLRARPLRERGHELLIRSLYQQGDVSGALAGFAAARAALIEQLGIEPGAELRELHQAVLRRDPTLERPPAARPAPPREPPTVAPVEPAPGSGGAVVPVEPPVPTCWLPRALADFTGRTGPAERLLQAMERAGPTAPVVQVIDGMAGVGKTTLVVHLATRLATRYPDAQLFIDLQGHSIASPVEPAAALVTLLRQLGVPAGRIPAELEHRIALWRSELAGRRVVLLLDNAGSSDQVEPLLPTAPGTLVLVTSRRRLLTGDGAPPESLPVLDEDEAVELLATIAGRERIRAEPEAAAAVVRRCGRLPLAIRLVGARLAHRPGWRVADLANLLDRDSPVLGELSVESRSVAGAFALSYEPLREPVRRMFRLLGLFPGEFFRTPTAAALTGLPLSEAESALADLVDHHLVEEPSAGRFRLHDLLREYAHQLVTGTESATERHEAVGQLLDLHLHAAAQVAMTLELPHQRREVDPGQPFRPDLVAALTPDTEWLEAEQTSFRALIYLAANADHARYAWQLARSVWRFYHMRGYFQESLEIHEVGLAAAKQLGDPLAVAVMSNYIASAHFRLADYRSALRHLDASIDARKGVGDRVGMHASLGNRAMVLAKVGRLRDSMAIYESVQREGLLDVRTNLGTILMMLGRCEEALRLHRSCLFDAIGARKLFTVAHELHNIAVCRLRLGQSLQAVRLIKACLALRYRTGNRREESVVLSDLATGYRHLGRLDDALKLHQQAVEMAVEVGERDAEAAALNDLGLTLAALGQPEPAVAAHRRALDLATRITHPYEQGRALAALAEHLSRYDAAAARRHWERALAIFSRMGVPERLDVERRLAGLAS